MRSRFTPKPLADQVIVITGASSGIGLATAYRAASRGARVVLVARNKPALDAAVDAIRSEQGQALAVLADVAERDQVQAVAQAAIGGFGSFDTWVNNAGVGMFGALDEVTESDHRRVFDVNYFGVVNGSLVAAEHFRRHGGTIVNLGSIASDITLPLQGPYSATKAAVRAFTDGLRMELIYEGAPVRLSLIHPLAIDTPFAEHARNYLEREPRLPPPVFAPEKVADAILQAAEHAGRDYYVGPGAKAATLANKLVPTVIDQVAARFAPAASKRFSAPQRAAAGNLFKPGRDGDVRGDNSRTRLHGRSANTSPAPSRAPIAATVALALLGTVLTMLGGRRT